MYDKRITLGNILTIIGMGAAVVAFFYQQTARIEEVRMEFHKDLGALRMDVNVQETRVDLITDELYRRMERIEQKLDIILDKKDAEYTK